eukprot:TRINITY_DN6364_c0_g2_i1.p1 TRINITY_DN6364_c0_g2~~TRINITY_DN6364_c0_g2_i1.p1  ORF type:complete len:162 (-),score=2.75 TRINITY_DN6364_c0_g2_i1:162-647(-)
MALALIKIMFATLAVTRVAAVRRDSGDEEDERLQTTAEGDNATMALHSASVEMTTADAALPAVVDAAGQRQANHTHSLLSVGQNASLEPITLTITAGVLAAFAAKIVAVNLIAVQGKNLICTLTGKLCPNGSYQQPVDTSIIGQYGQDQGQGQGSQYGGPR